MLELKQIRCFLTVCEELSFSKASRKLHMTQSSLSKIVLALEGELGIRLFDRSTRHLFVTDEGRALIPYAKKVLRNVESFVQVAVDRQGVTSGHIRFGLPPVIGSSFFPQFIADFRNEYPEIKLDIVEEGSEIVIKQLLDGQVDVAVAILPIVNEELEVIPIIERKLKLVVPMKHRLAEVGQVALSELEQEEFLMFSKGFALHNRVRRACIKAGFEPVIVQESGQWDFMLKMVALGNGICILPETICEHASLYQCMAIDIVEPSIDWNLALIRRKEGYVYKALHTWMEYILDKLVKEGEV